LAKLFAALLRQSRRNARISDMKSFFKSLFYKNYFWILVIVTAFLLFRIYTTVKYYGVCYDCSIYLSQAKYIYSLGASGYFEPLRPMVLALIVGFGWLLGIDISIFGTIISLGFSAASIYLVYLICREMKYRPAMLLAPFLLAVTPVYFFHSGQILTDIPSTFFALLSFYFFVKKKYAWTGFFAAAAFMARFPQGILLAAYMLVFFVEFIVSRKFKQSSKNFTKFLVPYFIVVIAYLIFNAFKYSSADTLAEAMFWPFAQGTYTIAHAGLWLYSGDIFYYFSGLITQNVFLIFALPFVFYYFYEKKYTQPNYNFLIFTLVLLFTYFTQMPHKEMRFALVFLPYAAIVSGIGFSKIFNKLGERLIIAFIILALVISVFVFPKIEFKEYTPPSGKALCDFINSHNISGPLVITTPLVMPCVDNKLEANFFSPPILIETLDKNPDAVLVHSSNSFLCADTDTECKRQIQQLSDYLSANYNLVFFDKQESSTIYIFKRK